NTDLIKSSSGLLAAAAIPKNSLISLRIRDIRDRRLLEPIQWCRTAVGSRINSRVVVNICMIFFTVLNIDKEITDHDGSFVGGLGIVAVAGAFMNLNE
ncbi:MAG: hypothetical protein WBL88_04380, partial [Nitrososphaeraceae archaeon]